MLELRSNQQGMSASGIVFVLALIAFFTLLTLRLAPLYYDNYKISSHLEAVAQSADFQSMAPAEIRSTVLKRLRIDNVISIPGSDIKIVQDRDKKSMDLNYEVRVPFIANVDFVAKFENHVEVAKR